MNTEIKYIDEFRDLNRAKALSEKIHRLVRRPWTLMEVCGGQTHAILKYGIDELLPSNVQLLHGPGCPVCVTPDSVIDDAIRIAKQPDTWLCTYGDMLRVPGATGIDLRSAQAQGAKIKVVYSPLDAVEFAKANPELQIVHLGVGFETTAPAHAMAILQAEAQAIANFSMLISHVLVPPALEAVLQTPQSSVNGFLAAGHVCTIMGTSEYQPIVEKYHVPIVVTGFEPVDLLEGIFLLLLQLETGTWRLENQYLRSVQDIGNIHARAAVEKVFQVQSQTWRGMGEIPASGLGLRSEYSHRDARVRLGVLREVPGVQLGSKSRERCQSGRVLTGQIKPSQCPEFGRTCTPDSPLGATMVSGEGACAAYFRYRRQSKEGLAWN